MWAESNGPKKLKRPNMWAALSYIIPHLLLSPEETLDDVSEPGAFVVRVFEGSRRFQKGLLQPPWPLRKLTMQRSLIQRLRP
ncbi:hypothetical protein NL676_006025 [Syzygium grande]|nr:hypothetical protein NL676_006025 [Syzygium grande]